MKELVVAQSFVNDGDIYVSTKLFDDGYVETLAKTTHRESKEPIFLRETKWKNLQHALRKHLEGCLFAVNNF
jgi:hypothetical protein